jgi:predicted transcriptional regulator
MSSDYLDDEQQIADERIIEEVFDCHALKRPVNELPELQPVSGVSPDTSVRDAIKQMTTQRVGCLLVLQDGQLLGVFSERDVLTRVAGSGIDIDATKVSELMTHRPETLPADSELVYALHKMAVGGYRHVPLLDASGSPVAVVSMRDIVGYIVSLYQKEVLNLPDPETPSPENREGA